MPRISAAAVTAGAVVLAALLGGAWWWSQRGEPAAPPLAPVTDTPSPSVAATATSAAPPAVTPSAPAADAAPIADGDEAVMAALVERFGRTAVLQLMQTDGFAARVVATVDNLPRGHVAPRAAPRCCS